MEKDIFPGGSDDKASAYNAGDPGSTPGLGRSPGEGNGNPHQYSCLENPMDGGTWWTTVHGVAKVGHNWETSLSFFYGERQGSLACCSPWGHKESYATEQLNWTDGEFNNNSWKLEHSTFRIFRTIKQKINKELEDLNNTVKNINIIDIYRTLHLKRQNRYSWQVHTEHSPS